MSSFLKQIMLTIIIFAILLKDTEGFSASRGQGTRTNNCESEFDLTWFMTFLGFVTLLLLVLILCTICLIYLINKGCCAPCMEDEEKNNDEEEEEINLPNNGENVTYLFVKNVPTQISKPEFPNYPPSMIGRHDGFSAIFGKKFCDNTET